MATSRIAPAWLIGLSMSPFGLCAGVVFYAVPQLLAARRVPLEQIASLTGVLLLPGLLCFLVAPILDVQFSRRFYATACCALGTMGLVAALLNQTDLRLFGVLLFLSYSLFCLFGAALGGWLASVVPERSQPALSAWINVANIGSAGLMAFLSMRIIRHFPLPVAAGLLACMVMTPLAIFLFIPAPGPDRRLASESFSGMVRAFVSLFRRREVLMVLLMFGLPSSTFTLTNILSGLGNDFQTPEWMVGLIGGVGVSFAGILASLAGGPLCARLPLRQLYLGIGIVGGVFTLSLLLLPHNPTAFAVAALGQNGFQALAFTAGIAIALRTVGHENALAATEYSILIGAMNLPMSYMQFIDGYAYASGGLKVMLLTDATVSISVCVGLLGLLAWLRMRSNDAARVSLQNEAAADDLPLGEQ